MLIAAGISTIICLQQVCVVGCPALLCRLALHPTHIATETLALRKLPAPVNGSRRSERPFKCFFSVKEQRG